jgi:hypothetical protein
MITRKRYERGQIAVITTLIIATLLGAASLGTDLALHYYNWVQLQKAADGAVLAGANYLPDDPVDAKSVAQTYATKNGVSSGEIVATTVAGDDMSVTMVVARTVPYLFASVLGLTHAQVSTTATAGIQTNSESARGLIPIGLPCSHSNCKYSAGQKYTLKQSQQGPGNWEALALGDNGAATYRTNMELGYTGTLSQNVTTEPGNVVGPTQQAINDRLSLAKTADPNGSWQAPTPYDPRLVVVPMVDFTNANGKSSLPIMQYALMWIDSLQGNNATINAYFLGTIPSSQFTSAVTNAGILSPILIR